MSGQRVGKLSRMATLTKVQKLHEENFERRDELNWTYSSSLLLQFMVSMFSSFPTVVSFKNMFVSLSNKCSNVQDCCFIVVVSSNSSSVLSSFTASTKAGGVEIWMPSHATTQFSSSITSPNKTSQTIVPSYSTTLVSSFSPISIISSSFTWFTSDDRGTSVKQSITQLAKETVILHNANFSVQSPNRTLATPVVLSLQFTSWQKAIQPSTSYSTVFENSRSSVTMLLEKDTQGVGTSPIFSSTIWPPVLGIQQQSNDRLITESSKECRNLTTTVVFHNKTQNTTEYEDPSIVIVTMKDWEKYSILGGCLLVAAVVTGIIAALLKKLKWVLRCWTTQDKWVT